MKKEELDKWINRPQFTFRRTYYYNFFFRELFELLFWLAGQEIYYKKGEEIEIIDNLDRIFLIFDL